MISSDTKYTKLTPLGSLSALGRVPACSRYRVLTKGCALVLLFLCCSTVVYVSRVYLFAQTDMEGTSVVSMGQTCSNCSSDVGSSSESIRDYEMEDGGDENGREERKGQEVDKLNSAEKTIARGAIGLLKGHSTFDIENARQIESQNQHELSNHIESVEDNRQLQGETAKFEVDALVKKFFYFNPRPGNRDWAEFGQCKEYSACAMADAVGEADVILFNAARMKYVDALPERRPNQIWVMYSREPPDLPSMDALDRADLLHQVNYTKMVYSDSTWQVLYGTLRETTPPSKNYLHNGGDLGVWYHDLKYDNFTGCHPETEQRYLSFFPRKIFHKKRFDVAWFVSHCERPSRRMEYVRHMMSTVDVHIYGSCGNYTCGDRGYNMGGEKDQCLDMLSRDYKFYLSFENTFCRDYISEKFFNVFEGVDVVPVVRGGGDYQRLFPSDILVDASDFPSPESLGTYLKHLGKDEKRYTKMLRKKNRYRKSRHKVDFHCDLCRRAHTGKPHHVYENFYKWVRAPGNCWKPTDLGPLQDEH